MLLPNTFMIHALWRMHFDGIWIGGKRYFLHLNKYSLGRTHYPTRYERSTSSEIHCYWSYEMWNWRNSAFSSQSSRFGSSKGPYSQYSQVQYIRLDFIKHQTWIRILKTNISKKHTFSTMITSTRASALNTIWICIPSQKKMFWITKKLQHTINQLEHSLVFKQWTQLSSLSISVSYQQFTSYDPTWPDMTSILINI